VVLFETAEAVAVKAERLVKANQLPLIIIDDSEDKVTFTAAIPFAFAPDLKCLKIMTLISHPTLYSSYDSFG